MSGQSFMQSADAEPFRSLVEKRITTDQYVRTLEERAHELRKPQPPQPSREGARDQS